MYRIAVTRAGQFAASRSTHRTAECEMSLRARTRSLYRRVVDGLRRTLRRYWGNRDTGADEAAESCEEERAGPEPTDEAGGREDADRANHPIDGDHSGLFVRTGVEL